MPILLSCLLFSHSLSLKLAAKGYSSLGRNNTTIRRRHLCRRPEDPTSLNLLGGHPYGMERSEKKQRGALLLERERLLADAAEYYLYYRYNNKNSFNEWLARNQVIDATVALIKSEAEAYAAKHGDLLEQLSEKKALNTIINALVVPDAGTSVDRDGLVTGLATILARTGAKVLDDVHDNWKGECPDEVAATQAPKPAEAALQADTPTAATGPDPIENVPIHLAPYDPLLGPKFSAGCSTPPPEEEDGGVQDEADGGTKPTVTLWLPDGQAGAVVGYRGAGLREISHSCGVKLNLCKENVRHNALLAVKERKLTLTGADDDAYQKAIDWVSETVAYVREENKVPKYANTLSRDAAYIPHRSYKRKLHQMNENTTHTPMSPALPGQDVGWLDGTVWREDDALYRVTVIEGDNMQFKVYKTVYNRPRRTVQLYAEAGEHGITLWYGEEGKWRAHLNTVRLYWVTHSSGRKANIWVRAKSTETEERALSAEL